MPLDTLVMERSSAAPISEVERHISDRSYAIVWCSVRRYLVRSGPNRVNNSERGIEPTETEVNTLLVPNFSGS